MRKYLDVTRFLTINILINNCNLIQLFFSVTVTDYSYMNSLQKIWVYYFRFKDGSPDLILYKWKAE